MAALGGYGKGYKRTHSGPGFKPSQKVPKTYRSTVLKGQSPPTEANYLPQRKQQAGTS